MAIETISGNRRIVMENYKKIDKREIPSNEEEIRLFLVARNEILRLPFWFTYYRKLGVDRFFVVDNASLDDSQNYLLKQSDTHVFYTEESFSNKEIWLKKLMDQYGIGHWCLVVDADELFQYPLCEEKTLQSLCGLLDKKGDTAMENLLVDMYPKNAVGETFYVSGTNFIEHSPYFDPYCYDRRLCMRRHILLGKKFPMVAYYGGTRKRLFGIEHLCCSKISLVKYSKRVFLDAGIHFVLGAKVSDVQGVVLHFKFLHDFFQRVQEEVIREEHFNHAKEYKQYQEKIDTEQFGLIYHDKSIKYINTEQLLNLGFMKICPNYTET